MTKRPRGRPQRVAREIDLTAGMSAGLRRRLEVRAEARGVTVPALLRLDSVVPEADQVAWAEGLGPTPVDQIRVLRDLIHHECGDQMSDTDLAICVRQLGRLQRAYRQVH